MSKRLSYTAFMSISNDKSNTVNIEFFAINGNGLLLTGRPFRLKLPLGVRVPVSVEDSVLVGVSHQLIEYPYF